MSRNQSTVPPLLQVDSLAVTFHTPQGTVRAVRDATLTVNRGELVGLAGESGCGKSTTAFGIIGYLPSTATIQGAIKFEGADVGNFSESELRHMRGNRIAMVYQDPATSLNPTMRVGPQVQEVLREHLGMNVIQAREKTTALFDSVGLAEPHRIGMRYPHQLSGGMQQRVVIAMALACEPDLLIMDEPTTGLDVTTEATILDLVLDLKHRVNAGILYVSHNLGVIARIADRVVVMYAGQTVEQAPVRQLFKSPQHPYTVGLLDCVPQPLTNSGTVNKLRTIPGSVYASSISTAKACLFASRCPMVHDLCKSESPDLMVSGSNHESRCFFWQDVDSGIWGPSEPRDEPKEQPSGTLLEASRLRRFYGRWQRKYLLFGPRIKPPVRAVTDVNFSLGHGRTIGIVGESGSGKTTVARTVVGLVPRDRGDILLKDQHLAPEVGDRDQTQQSAIRMVFQNPSASLNPKLPIGYAIIRSLRKFAGLNKQESRLRAAELLTAVGLDPAYLDRRPSQLSGGEQQRVALAGSFAGQANIIVADEAVSALDVSVQAQVLNLLHQHQHDLGTSYIFISHDLGVIKYISDDILVLYAGHVAETGPAENVLNAPSHPYTEALLSAAPTTDPDAIPTTIRLPGSVPSLRRRFDGCFFAGRCPKKLGPICDDSPPPKQMGPGSDQHFIYCHIPVDDLADTQ